MFDDGEVTVPAATLLLLRDAADGAGPEIFMVSRNRALKAFSGALVFPGGKIDAADAVPDLTGRCRGEPDGRAAPGAAVAAIREAFEECGVLLAYRDDGVLPDAAELAGLAEQRRALHAGELDLLALCRQRSLTLALDRLTLFARWITPRNSPKIFDTWFFVARLPDGQRAEHDGVENHDSVWLRPADALARAEAGEFSVPLPTRLNLSRLAAYDSVDAALAAAARVATIHPVRPQIDSGPDGRHIRLPAAAGYGTRIFAPGDGSRLVVLE